MNYGSSPVRVSASRTPTKTETTARTVSMPVRAVSVRNCSVYLLLILVLSVAWLFSPSPQTSICGAYVPLNGSMGFIINCDAKAFIHLAQQPLNLLNEKEIRQSRPLYAVLGALFGYPFSVALSAVVPKVSAWIPYYVGFVVINFILLGAAVLLFDRLLSMHAVPHILILLLSVFLISNDVTKAFIWTAHQQLFSIFTPLFIVYAGSLLVARANAPGAADRLWPVAALIAGLLVLLYGNFVVSLPILLFMLYLRKRDAGTVCAVRTLSTAVLTTIAFFAPTIAWIIFSKAVAGSYYSHELVKYRQIVWMHDELEKGFGALFGAFGKHSYQYLSSFLTVDIAPFVVVAAGLLICRVTRGGPRRLPVTSRAIDKPVNWLPLLAAVTFVAFFVFFWVLGYYRARLTFTLVPLLLYYIGIETAEHLREMKWLEKPVVCILAVMAGLWIVFHVFKSGPFV